MLKRLLQSCQSLFDDKKCDCKFGNLLLNFGTLGKNILRLDFTCSVYCVYYLKEQTVINYFCYDSKIGMDYIYSNLASNYSPLFKFYQDYRDNDDSSFNDVVNMIDNLFIVHICDINAQTSEFIPKFKVLTSLGELRDNTVYERLVKTKEEYYASDN